MAAELVGEGGRSDSGTPMFHCVQWRGEAFDTSTIDEYK